VPPSAAAPSLRKVNPHPHKRLGDHVKLGTLHDKASEKIHILKVAEIRTVSTYA
jgi:hypothetical protein